MSSQSRNAFITLAQLPWDTNAVVKQEGLCPNHPQLSLGVRRFLIYIQLFIYSYLYVFLGM
jgi:hypothetical protein